jgi:hypothetical protein
VRSAKEDPLKKLTHIYSTTLISESAEVAHAKIVKKTNSSHNTNPKCIFFDPLPSKLIRTCLNIKQEVLNRKQEILKKTGFPHRH